MKSLKREPLKGETRDGPEEDCMSMDSPRLASSWERRRGYAGPAEPPSKVGVPAVEDGALLAEGKPTGGPKTPLSLKPAPPPRLELEAVMGGATSPSKT